MKIEREIDEISTKSCSWVCKALQSTRNSPAAFQDNIIGLMDILVTTYTGYTVIRWVVMDRRSRALHFNGMHTCGTHAHGCTKWEVAAEPTVVVIQSAPSQG